MQTHSGLQPRLAHSQKSDEQLVSLREAGLGIVYIGAESGSEEVLLRVNKGETPQEILEGVQKAERSV